MTLKNIVDATAAMQKIAGQDMSQQTRYRFRRFMGKVNGHLEYFDDERRKILEDCCTLKDGEYIPRKDKIEELNQRMKELLGVEIDEKIPPMTIPMTESIKLNYFEEISLDGLVEFEHEEETTA